MRSNPTHFFEPLTKEATVGGNYRKSCTKYHKKYGSTPTVFGYDHIAMNNKSHWPTHDSPHNSYYTINDPVVLVALSRDIGIINTSPTKFVNTKEARAAQSHKIPFQLSSRHTHTYKWWIKTYPGVPYGKHPAAGGVS